MLSRVAENLFWIGRSIERADNVARLIDTARRMVTLPTKSGRGITNEWSSILIAAGASKTYQGDLDSATREQALEHLVSDPLNPSSIYNSIKNARENARAIRFGVTSEVWSSLNTAWNDFPNQNLALQMRRSYLPDFVDWVKTCQAQYRGAVEGTMVRDDSLEFLRLGANIERADATARILDVKYHVLLPSLGEIGGPLDQYQWASLLQAVGVQRAYYFVTREEVSRRGVATFLIKNEKNPRSMAFCIGRTLQAVNSLSSIYGRSYSSQDSAKVALETIRNLNVEFVLDAGLHEYLTQFIDETFRLSGEIAENFAFAPPLIVEDNEPDMVQSQTG